jgi:predicted permease
MYTFTQDIRFALRQLRKSLGFTVMATATLALGIGAATAVFSLVDAVLLKPLPFPQPERIVALDTLERERGSASGPATLPNDTSYPNFFDWRDRAKSFESMAAYNGGGFTYESGSGPARRLRGMNVTADFFSVLGVSPALGRGFTRAEEQAGNRSVVISQGLWQSALSGNRNVLGESIRLNDESYTVIGVMPKEFQFPGSEDADVWVTSANAMEGKNASGKQRGWNQLDVIARLAPAVGIEQARAEMQTIQQGLVAQFPDDDKSELGVSVKPELETLVGDVERPLHILFAAVCSLLLIVCANVAGLLLTRTASRRPELAVRAALGASRVQIVRQLLIEALTLSTLGGVGGLVLAALALKLAPGFLPPQLPRINGLALNSDVFLFALAASVLTGLLFGVLPAWRVSKLDPALALRDNARGSTAGRGQHRLHSALVIGETALGLVLLVGAGLLIRSFNKIMNVDPGFDPKNVLTFRIAVPGNRFDDAKLLQFMKQVQMRLSAIPGVREATYGFPMPLAVGDMSITFSIDGQPTAPGDQPSARASAVAYNFFETMKMRLLRGRFFSAAEDRTESPPVVIVNQAFAERYFPGQNAVGKRIKTDLSNGDVAPMREIVGVVGNTTGVSLTENMVPEYYVPFAQATVDGTPFAIRVTGDPDSYIESVRAAVAQQDPTLPVFNARPYTDSLARSTAQQRFQTILISAFAVIALALSAIGLYAVLSYMVAQRTMELGLRIALGAQRGNILELILRRGLVLSVAGLVIGLAASAALTRFLATLLFATKALDAATFVGMALLLFAISTVACLVPAYRASRLDPIETLRQQ